MPFCIHCGSQEPEGMAFCGSCGQSMTTLSTTTNSHNPLQQSMVTQTRNDPLAETVASAPAPLPIEESPAATHFSKDGRVTTRVPRPTAQGKKPLPLKTIMPHLPACIRLPGRWGLVLALIVLMGGGGIWATWYLLAPSAYDQFVMKNGIQFGFDAQHSGFNPYETELSPTTVALLVQAWTATTNRAISSSPAVANGVIYAGTSDGKLYAFKADGCDQSTCPPLWTAATDGSISSSPAVLNGVAYVNSAYVHPNDGKLYAFRADGCGQVTCSPLWSARTGRTNSSPVVDNGVIYVSSGDNKLYAFKANSCGQPICSPLWTATASKASFSSPAVANGVIYVSSGDSKLYAFKANGCGQVTCSPLWTAATADAIASPPVVAKGVVYVSSGDGQVQTANSQRGDSQSGKSLGSLLSGSHYQAYSKLYAFKADGCGQVTCSPLWTTTISGVILASPAVANGVVYVDAGDDKLYAFKADGCGQPTCSPLWTAATDLTFSSPTVANGVVYVASGKGKLYALKANGCDQTVCSPLWTATTGSAIGSSPVVANGMVYVGTNSGMLYAFHRK